MGIGHLVRSVAVAEAMAQTFDVVMAWGGEPVEGMAKPRGVEMVELGEWEAARGERQPNRFLELARAWKPELIVTEMYPFGRKSYDGEVRPVLEWARRRSGTVIAASLRDILIARKDRNEFEGRVCGLTQKYYHLVMVHGDERMVRLEETFSRAAELGCPVKYTGYVRRAVAGGESAGRGGQRIVVSNGGGKCASGHALLRASARAAALLRERLPHSFAIYTGPLAPEGLEEELRRLGAGARMEVARFTPDLCGAMKGAALSVSMGGYNTLLDVLAAGTRALVYPEVGNADNEQKVRAELLERMGAVKVLGDSDMEPARMAEAMAEAVERRAGRVEIDLDGAVGTVEILAGAVEERTAVAELG